MTKNWFPMRVKIAATKEVKLVKNKEDLPNEPYRVLETRVRK